MTDALTLHVDANYDSPWAMSAFVALEEKQLPYTLATKVLSKKETSDGKRGVVKVETKGINQRGEEVCEFRRSFLVWKREFAPTRGYPYGDDVFAQD